MATDRDILDIIERMWDASTDVGKWEAVLKRTTEAFSSVSAQLSYFNKIKAELSFTAYYNTLQENIPLYAKMIIEGKDPLTQYCLKYPGRPLHCRMFSTDEEIRQSPIYTQLLGAQDYEYRMGIVYPQEDLLIGLGVLRGAARSPFTADDCERFGLLLPHLRHATRLHVKFAELDLDNRHKSEVLDRFPTGIVITDGAAHILYANALAQDILRDRDGLGWCDDQVVAPDPATTRQIREHIAAAVDRAQAGEILPGTAMVLDRPSGGPALSLLIAPLWSNILRYKLSPLDRPLAVLFVTDPARRTQTPAEALQGLFGLSKAEARVLELLVSGLAVKEIAAFVGRTQETIRSQLKAILQKTATTRQADLVRLVLSSTAWLRATESGPGQGA